MLRLVVPKKVHSVITKPVFKEISQNIKILSCVEIRQILVKLVEDFWVFWAQMKVRDQMNQSTFSKDFRVGAESVSRASWRTRRISLTFATPLIRMMAWDSKSTIV